MCNCIPSTNQFCQEQNSISVAQPVCQILPDGSSQVNPYFDMMSNISYWSYKLVSVCDITQSVTPLDIYIPIYENISQEMVNVEERILSCGRFEQVPFDFENPAGTIPPLGFQYLHIPFNSRFQTGVGVNFRVSLLGNFPTASGAIFVNTNTQLLEFDAGYLVPSEPPSPRLTVTKTGDLTIDGTSASIDYNVTVTNTGNTDLDNIMLVDTITYDSSSIVIGQITPPAGINVDTSVPGTIRLTGDLGTLAMGESTSINYIVPIESFAVPNTFVFSSSTVASNSETQGTTNTEVAIPVVALTTGVGCMVLQNNEGEFTYSLTSVPQSPLTEIDLSASINIPDDVIIQFTSYGMCDASFITGGPVPLNTDVSNARIIIDCSASIPPNGTMTFTINFRVVSITSLQGVLQSIIDAVRLQTENSQVFLGATPIPNSTTLTVDLDASCDNVCVTP